MARTSTLLFSIFAVLAVSSPILPRDGKLGLHFAESSGCTPDQVNGVMNAIADTRTLAQGAILALKTPRQNPAAYFFPPSYAHLATWVFSTILTATQSSDQLDSMDADSNLNPIQLTCQDVSSMCNTPAPDNNGGNTSPRLGYIPEGSNPTPGFGTAQIVICPAMFELPRTPAPCTGTPGLANLGWGF